MKAFIIFLIFLYFSFSALGQADSLGFTNKAEAKNLMVNGVKEGKWVEYFILDKLSDAKYPTKDTSAADDYVLIVYKGGKIYGLSREYRFGILWRLTPYKNGKKNGVQKNYSWDNGKTKLYYETPYINGKINGVQEWYYESGKLNYKTPYINGVIEGMQKWYWESGKINFEIPYINGKMNGVAKTYCQNGAFGGENHYKNGRAIDTSSFYNCESGKLSEQIIYVNANYIVTKDYDKNGKLVNETTTRRGKNGVMKSYDENGNEIK